MYIYKMATGLTPGRRTRLLQRTPVRQVHRAKKNYSPKRLPAVSPKSLRLRTAEQFWHGQTPVRGQRYIKTPAGFLNEYNFFTHMLPTLQREANTLKAQNMARKNEAARRIQRAWRHTKPSLTPANFQKIYIMQMLYRTKPAFRLAVNDANLANNLRNFRLTKSQMNHPWWYAKTFLH